MKIRNQKSKIENAPQTRHCNECQLAAPDYSDINRDTEGRYFMLKCPYDAYKRFHHSPACGFFVPRAVPLEKPTVKP